MSWLNVVKLITKKNFLFSLILFFKLVCICSKVGIAYGEDV